MRSYDEIYAKLQETNPIREGFHRKSVDYEYHAGLSAGYAYTLAAIDANEGEFFLKDVANDAESWAMTNRDYDTSYFQRGYVEAIRWCLSGKPLSDGKYPTSTSDLDDPNDIPF